jgi:hypothetical protein
MVRVMSSDELPRQRVAGVEYLSCEWCGGAVSQVGTRTPRRYCKRSHRQRAFEARRLGVPMMHERQKASGTPAAADASFRAVTQSAAARGDHRDAPC